MLFNPRTKDEKADLFNRKRELETLKSTIVKFPLTIVNGFG